MKVKTILLLFAAFYLTAAGAKAQESFVLNEPTSLHQKVTADQEKFFFSLNEDVLENPDFTKGARFIFETSNGAREFIINRKTEYFPGYTSVIASREGQKENLFSFTYYNGRLSGIYHESHNQTMLLGYDEKTKLNYLSASKDAETVGLVCGVHNGDRSLLTPPRKFAASKLSRQKATKKAGKSLLYGSEDDSVTIDIMLVYTDAAETWALTSPQGDINGVMAQALNLSQTALNNSNAKINLRLVHTYKTSYDEENDGVDSNDRLRRFTQNPDNPQFEAEYDGYMEEIHDLRDQHGADIVSLIVRISDTGGLGWRLGSSGGEEAYAFNLNRVQQVAGGYTLIHEIGHNMGNAHSRTQDESAAKDAGGLYHYSVGYQDSTNDFYTIMAYNNTKGGQVLNSAPVFSSPGLTFQGHSAGTNNFQTPEDNARSMKEIKWSIASYRPSVVDAPVASVSANEIEVEMNREDEFTASFDISNSGNSGLMWSADFDFISKTVEKPVQEQKEGVKPILLKNPIQSPANFSGTMNRQKAHLAESVLYNTSFESNEGFSNGSYSGRSEWRALSDTEFMISGVAPNTGSQHLRLAYDGSGSTQFIASPFFGYQLFGEYEVTINFLISDINETYDFYIFDGKTGGYSAGVIIDSGSIFTFDIGEQGNLIFPYSGQDITANSYQELRIVYNTANETIDYYYNGGLIAQNDYLNGFTPGVIQVLHRNQVSGAYMDVDDIEVKQLDAPYEWLSVPSMSGVVFEGTSGQVELTFNTEGISTGTYETLLKITTNDPNNPEYQIPITLTVNDVVSNETEQIPHKITLNQNYPNPFNPSTTIRFNLSEAQEVRLEVFNMQGQKVATLLNQKKNQGEHKVLFDASSLSSGIYVYRLITASQMLTRKMVLIK
ncbi:zinc-dependent metalloprotease [Gracilimonas sp.]|uniref:zinc-dependent metalloprotease n=1 Tax=Gracilimonas sp. TaxID=1974203 RepID=UPI0032EE3A9F